MITNWASNSILSILKFNWRQFCHANRSRFRFLPQMSRIFLGTTAAEPFSDGQTSKIPRQDANRVVLALTLEELDRPIHCPDGVDGGE